MGDHRRASHRASDSVDALTKSTRNTKPTKDLYVNIRSLSRGDGVVIGAAVLLLIASFLSLYAYGDTNAWQSLHLLMSVYLAGVIAAGLIVTARALPQPRKVAGLELGQFGVALSVFAAWTAFWAIIDSHGAGAGLILGLIAALVQAAAAVATPLVPALKVALVGAPRPQVPGPYGNAGATQGYGYPGAQQQGGYGYPGGQQQSGQSYGGQQAPAGDSGATAGGAAGATPAAGGPADFAPFWFAVPVARPLYSEEGSPSPIAELAPGTWYLAVEQRGAALIAQTQDGRRGILQDTTGIQRG
ncbi:putative integral membrane protein [Streptomyces noursei ATCC 11455]|nr:putative integral membrane protein [Streptomyces noursei ATCC 11455]